MWDNRKPTVQLMGKFQPFNDEHLSLFRHAHEIAKQVCIMVRDVPVNENSPYEFVEVKEMIVDKLTEAGYFEWVDYTVIQVPNVTTTFVEA